MAEVGKKRESETDLSTPSKKKKGVKSSKSLLVEVPSDECPFNFTSPEDLLKSLISPACSLDEFFDKFWEKSPLHIKAKERGNASATDKWAKYFGKLFNKEVLKEIIKDNKLHYEADLNICKYDSIAKVRRNFVEEGAVKYKLVNEQFSDHDMTLQFHQPQRFHNELWKIQALMESYFGCLVGSNIYMTPEGTQGLAPHYDDVEVFILQLEGSKAWKLHSPVKQLPRECSQDLSEATVDKLDLLCDITLNPGDVLYFPRGTVHAAKATKGHSTHLTISTYQNHSWGDYLISSIPSLADRATDNAAVLRKGLPINYHSKKESILNFKVQLKEAIHAMADAINKENEFEVMDSITCDFFANRLPPLKFTNEPIGKTPSLHGSVKFAFPDGVFISNGRGPYEEDDTMDDDDLEETDEGSCDLENDPVGTYVYHSLCNDRTSHMVGEAKIKPKGLCFDESCWDGLIKLKRSKNEFISVKELNLPDLMGLDMLVGLWAEGLLVCKSN